VTHGRLFWWLARRSSTARVGSNEAAAEQRTGWEREEEEGKLLLLAKLRQRIRAAQNLWARSDPWAAQSEKGRRGRCRDRARNKAL
jgi:hypothetical protein